MNIFKFSIHLENQPPDSIAKLCLNICVSCQLKFWLFVSCQLNFRLLSVVS